jgi:hypothetical protein
VDADELKVRANGVQERAEEVKNAGLALGCETFPNGRNHLKRGVIERCEKECETGCGESLTKGGGVCIDSDAEFFKDVRTAAAGRDGAVAVLYDAGTSGCENEHGCGGDVEEFEAVAPGAADVDKRTGE